jgi:hypothetical protein
LLRKRSTAPEQSHYWATAISVGNSPYNLVFRALDWRCATGEVAVPALLNGLWINLALYPPR